MPVNVQIVFYSMYGHIHQLAEAVAEGAGSVPDTTVGLYQVPELIPEESLVRTGAKQAKGRFAHIPLATPEQLTDADAILFGAPTRYGNVVAQMQNFIDRTGKLWLAGSLIGKVGSVFTSTATQHGGQETTIRSLHTELFHHGMIVVGVPYSCKELTNMDEITGGSPYGAGTLAGGDGSRQPSENELAIGRFQGRHVAEIAAKIKAGTAALGAGTSAPGGKPAGGEGRTVATTPNP